MKDAITDAALTKQEEDTSTKLYRTQDAAKLAGIQGEIRNARKRFNTLADRLNLKPADERRRDSGGGSLQKFWTLEQVQAIADRVERIKKYSADAGRNVIKIGYELAAAKAEIPHGDWGNWLDENFQWKERTAQYYMSLAERFGDNPEFATFKPSQLQAMLPLPKDEVQDFINVQAEIGKPIDTQSAREVQAAVKQYKKRKKNPAPVTADTPNVETDSEPVNDISTNGAPNETKSENACGFEGDKPRNDAIFKGYCTPCEPIADLTQQAEETAIISANSPADAQFDSELANIFALIDAVTDANKLRRIQAHINQRLAAIQEPAPQIDSELDAKKISVQLQTDADNQKSNTKEILA